MLGLILLIQALTVAVAGPPTSPEYLPIRVADADGDFAREGIRVTLRSTRAESSAAEALAQGQAELAATSLEAVLRFAHRPEVPLPRIVFGLTAAPPVALVVPVSRGSDGRSRGSEGRSRGSEVRSVRDLAGQKIGLTLPGAPEQTWLETLLARAQLDPTRVDLVALGNRGIVVGVEAIEVQAALVPEPAATKLIDEGRATVLVDLRSPRAAERALGGGTVNAAVFVRGERRPSDRDIAAFLRAVLAAERRIATASSAALAARLPRSVVGVPDEFDRRLETSRSIYLAEGLVSPAAVRLTIDMIRAHLPLAPTLKIRRGDDLLHLDPLRAALRPRPPA
jgi:ABC-type nitrate/sulfonate/bicarbonate transport system substrate-binding protein